MKANPFGSWAKLKDLPFSRPTNHLACRGERYLERRSCTSERKWMNGDLASELSIDGP